MPEILIGASHESALTGANIKSRHFKMGGGNPPVHLASEQYTEEHFILTPITLGPEAYG